MKKFDVIIIGAGPAGLFCTIEASRTGVRVCILEKNDHPGQKLLISGSGQCNVTHGGSIRDFLQHYGTHRIFLKPALFHFSNMDLMKFFEKRGCPLTETEKGKIFPRSEKAGDILAVLLEETNRGGAEIHYHSPVREIINESGTFTVKTENDSFQSECVIISTGGKSYPGTGSTGDGYGLAASLGHTIIEPVPALTPVLVEEYPYRECAGISISEAIISLYREGKKINTHQGDILFTHRGLSGPGILDFSRHLQPGDTLTVSLLPSSSDEELQSFLTEKSRSAGKKSVKGILSLLDIPGGLLREFLARLEIPAEMKAAEISRKQRNLLIENLLRHPFRVKSLGNFNEAMVTAGGVSLEEINPKTMESTIVPGLFFAGEVMDIDGDTGGYNLQAAFSTGALAGKSSAEQIT